ncbi:SDR family NAD(P)-dependent oxidoreductase [Actinoplanes oblitus]|uniref:SDR family NAD(P)-dependent oxidoreductase n=1 Tax=Actinoplanes oblitus TaxID=3040509 RepID=A0ABY8WPZ8_9ACTN|nr:SDR family NAD(P)-dependent oxidoreductase [Actinoplanes oblitus]WIM99956.1 SDR family NAD(P)-dependent oxidoreductase [Actinoplanes oblitus]
MTQTIAIIGAGPGLGLAIARTFGRQGFQVGLVARDAAKLAGLVGLLQADGVTAAAFPADIRDRDALTRALSEVCERLGPIDVLEYSPGPQGAPISSAVQMTVDSATAQFELNVLGAITAVEAVLPGMLQRGTGGLLFTTGVSSVIPVAFLSNTGIAMAGLRNWALALHEQLADKGIYVGTVTIATQLAEGAGEGDPAAVADRYWTMYQKRDHVEETVGDIEAFRSTVAAITARRQAAAGQ